MSYGVRLKVWGERACFTRPEMKGERVSYDVITPSAARGILEAIHWKPAIQWVVERIHVLNPIRFESIRRNELAGKLSANTVKSAMKGKGRVETFIEENRQQRVTYLLRDVAYLIEARFEMTAKAGPGDNTGKHRDMFLRRAGKGQAHHQPYLGCREFPASFAPLRAGSPPPPSHHDGERDLGWMLHDIDFVQSMTPRFFRAVMRNGIIDVPPFHGPETVQ